VSNSLVCCAIVFYELLGLEGTQARRPPLPTRRVKRSMGPADVAASERRGTYVAKPAALSVNNVSRRSFKMNSLLISRVLASSPLNKILHSWPPVAVDRHIKYACTEEMDDEFHYEI
jgi:hypothetical protein